MVAFTEGQVYRKNLDTGRLDLVSSTSAGEPGDGSADYPTISATGRFVAFVSRDSNLAPDDTDTPSWEASDVFVKDFATGETEIVSVNSQEESADGPSGYLDGDYYDQTVTDISGDGRFVAFTSDAMNLALGDTNGRADVFIRDRQAGTTERVSLPTTGIDVPPAVSGLYGGQYGASSPSMSSDGRYVAFITDQSFEENDNNFDYDVYLRDRSLGTTTWLSSTPEGLASDGWWWAWSPAISDDGRYIAMEVVLPQSPSAAGVYVYDRTAGTKTHEVPKGVEWPALSGDGRFLSYELQSRLYRLDRNTREAVVIDGGCFGATPNTTVRHGWNDDSVSSDGSRIVYWSRASNLVGQDLNGSSDIFLWDAADSDATNPQCQVDTKSLSSAQTWGRGLHSAHCTVCRGDPVNTATGNYTESINDLSMPGIGLPFQFTRTYNSADTSVGPLGQGWTHSYAPSLELQPDSSLRFRAEDGARLNYMPDGAGNYQALLGARSHLSDRETGGQKLVSKDQIEYHFDANGRLERMRDRNGNELLFNYATGNLTSIQDTAGRTISFTYNESGRLIRVALPDERSVQYGYTNGLLTSVIDPRGHTRTYSYDLSGRVTDEFDQNGNLIVHNVYGADGRVTSQTDGRGQITTFSWNPTTQTATTTDPRGKVWKDVYSNNLLQRQIDPLGEKRSYVYDENLNVKRVVDQRGHATRMSYDGRGNLLSRQAPAPLSYQETWNYNARNDVTSYVDGGGNETSFGYDPDGNLVTLTQPGNTITSYGRDPATGLTTSITDPRNKTTRFEYDSNGNLIRVISPMGSKTTYGYDLTGRRTSMVEARGNQPGTNPLDYTWNYAYNDTDQITSVTDPLGSQTSYIYDLVGNLRSVTDDNNHTTEFVYNPAKDLLSVTAPDLTVTSYTYDPNGNLKTRTNAENHVISYEYDLANRLSSITTPEGDVSTYAYDAAGNLASQVDANGNATATAGDGVTAYAYDALDRLTAVDYSDATPDVTFSYDANDNSTGMVDGAGSVSYSFDALDRLTAVTRGAEAFAYVYDAAGNVTSRTYPNASPTTYVYDDDGRMISATSADRETSYTYDVANHQTGIVLPNGHASAMAYDAAGRLEEVKNLAGAAIVSRFTYVRDGVGNPMSITTPSEVTNYLYDSLDRLTDVCIGGTCTDPLATKTSYVYDPVGNRIEENDHGAVTTYSHDDDDELLQNSGPGGAISYGHDDNGNMTAAGSKTYIYDLANRLRTSTQGGGTTTYAYDGNGARRTVASGATTTTFLWDINYAIPQLAMEAVGPTTATLRSYIYGTSRIAMNEAGTVPHYYQHDGLGSVIGMSSLSGSEEWAYSYDAFGKTDQDEKLNALAPENPMSYTGEYLDATGLYHLRARQYDPSLGRFTATDPRPPSLTDAYVTAYTYVNDRPTMFTDPTGRWMRAPSLSEAWDDVSGAASWAWDNVGEPLLEGACDVVRTVGPAVAAAGKCLGKVVVVLDDAATTAGGVVVAAGGAATVNPAAAAFGVVGIGAGVYNLSQSYPAALNDCGLGDYVPAT